MGNKNKIVKKLQKFLKNHPEFKEECDVVYLMAEIRKRVRDLTVK